MYGIRFDSFDCRCVEDARRAEVFRSCKRSVGPRQKTRRNPRVRTDGREGFARWPSARARVSRTRRQGKEDGVSLND